jgi:hypothetical protein
MQMYKLPCQYAGENGHRTAKRWDFLFESLPTMFHAFLITSTNAVHHNSPQSVRSVTGHFSHAGKMYMATVNQGNK